MFQLHLEEKKPSLNKEIVFDVIIVGAGAAGLTAGIYLARDGWKTLILEKESPGGLAASTQRVENYPGFPKGIEGSTLMTRFESQAERFGVYLVDFEKVERISKNKQDIFEIHTQQGTYKAHTVLLATGSVPKHLGITGEDEFFGKGVSYCATCDGPLYRDQEVAVVGFGDSALQEGETLLRYASKLT